MTYDSSDARWMWYVDSSPYKKVFVSKFLYKNFEGIFHYFSMISWNKNLNSHFLSEFAP